MVGLFDQFLIEKHGLTPAQKASLPPSYGMHFELQRLGSFKSWPRWAPVQPNRLARGGFYYTGSHDEVACFECCEKVKQWHQGDRANDRHRRVNPQCPFLLGRETTNIPLPRPENQGLPEARTAADNRTRERDHPAGSSSVASGPSISQQRSPTIPADLKGDLRPVSVLLPEYQNKPARRQTFKNWPDTACVGPEELAQAGFVYLGNEDRVQCAFCKGVLRNWAPGDRAFSEHQKHFPRCPFVRNPTAAAAVDLEKDQPKHPNYGSEDNRWGTFSQWPTHLSQKPGEMAKAGFFYVGEDDLVRCFWCGGGLRNWEPDDDPWVEHARHFPKCGYLKKMQRSEFIGQVMRDPDESDQAADNSLSSSDDSLSSSGSVDNDIDHHEMPLDRTLSTEIINSLIDRNLARDLARDLVRYCVDCRPVLEPGPEAPGTSLTEATASLVELENEEMPPSLLNDPFVEVEEDAPRPRLRDQEDEQEEEEEEEEDIERGYDVEE